MSWMQGSKSHQGHDCGGLIAPVTALHETAKGLVLVGCGNVVKAVAVSTNELLATAQVFAIGTVFGFCPIDDPRASHSRSHVVCFGSKEIAVIALDQRSPQITLLSHMFLRDRVWKAMCRTPASWKRETEKREEQKGEEKGEQAEQKDKEEGEEQSCIELVVVLGHNVVEVWKAPISSLRTSASQHNGLRAQSALKVSYESVCLYLPASL